MIYLVRHGLDDESYIGGYSEIDLINIGRESIHDLGELDKGLLNGMKKKRHY